MGEVPSPGQEYADWKAPSPENSADKKPFRIGDQTFQLGQQVSVARGDGRIEQDWALMGVINGRVIVRKPSSRSNSGKELVKTLHQKSFLTGKKVLQPLKPRNLPKKRLQSEQEEGNFPLVVR